VWALAAVIATVAGWLLSPITFVHSNMGFIGLKALPAAVVGGFGSMPGAIVGGIVIGVVEGLAGFWLPEGFKDIADPACAAMLDRFNIADMNRATAGHYAKITAALRRKNQLIGTNDLWIAAAALAHDFPLVTNNTAHFERVPGLQLISY